MKTLVFLISMLVYSNICISQNIPAEHLYLGQTPDTVPVKFDVEVSPGFFAAERVAITNDGLEIYFSELDGYFHNARIKYYRYRNGKWNGPSTLFENFFSPSLSVDGKRMFMQNVKNPQNEVWYSSQSDTGWSIPIKFMPNKAIHYMLWETDNHHLYVGSYSAKGGLGQRDWSRIILTRGDTIIQSLGAPLCTTGDDVDYCISRDESMIFIADGSKANRKSYSKSDLFISFHNKDETWTNPKNLGTTININDTTNGRWAPCITADNKYLFYTQGWTHPALYWVKINSYIDRLKNSK